MPNFNMMQPGQQISPSMVGGSPQGSYQTGWGPYGQGQQEIAKLEEQLRRAQWNGAPPYIMQQLQSQIDLIKQKMMADQQAYNSSLEKKKKDALQASELQSYMQNLFQGSQPLGGMRKR